MLSFKAENFHDVIKPIHACSKVIGLTSFSFRKKDNQNSCEAFVTFINAILIIASSSWSLFTITRLIFYDTIWDLNREYLSKVFESSSRIVLSVFTTIIMLVSWWQMVIKGKFAILLESIFEIDQSLIDLNAPVNHL